MTHPARPGQLTFGWRFLMCCLWVAALLAVIAVWRVSTQLGLSTWWLGPRGDRMPIVVNMAPFAGPVVAFVCIVYNMRHLPLIGAVAALSIVAVGIGDLGRVPRLAALELGIGAVVVVASLASYAGVYRSANTPR